MNMMNQLIKLDGIETALVGQRGALANNPFVVGADLYARGGLFAKVIDKPADKAVDQGVIIQGDQDNVMSNELERLNVLTHLANALRWSRLYGGAALIMVADDGSVNEPVDPSKLNIIEEFKVFPVTSISAGEQRYMNPLLSNYGLPIFYKVRAKAGTVFYVHESRLIEIPGDPLPEALNSTGIPWFGRNAIDQTYPAICRYLEALSLSKNILYRKQQGIYSMAGLAELIQNDMEAVVQKRINLVDMVRGILNTVAIDAEDKYELKDMSLTGIPELLAEYQIEVSAHSGMSVTVLFGRSPGGMNSTGESDFESWYELPKSLQKTRLTPALERIVSLIYAQSSVKDPQSEWKIEWPPMRQATDKERAELRKANAEAEAKEMDALATAIGNELISQEEAADYMREERRFGLEPAEVADTSKTYAQQT